MDRSNPHGRRRNPEGARATSALVVLLLVLCLCLFPPFPSVASTDNGGKGTFEDRAAAERLSRSRYRNLEVASLVVILVAGAGAVLWAIRRRKP